MQTLEALAAHGLITPSQVAHLAPVAARYAVAITPAMADLIDSADPADPIARQFIPSTAELNTLETEHADPIGDHVKTVVPGLVHRYPDRVLLKVSGICPVYCRFCFRREMVGPGAGTTLAPDEIANALAYIAATPAIWEVILTGGDPLILSPRRIRELTTSLAAIPHVKVIRWHTRVPIVTPQTVTPDMIAALKSPHQAVYVAIHANHAREFSAQARASLARLADAGIVLVSQSVLLRGVNDSVDALEALMRAFVECRVTPYYLHHPDLAPGTSHFRLTIAEGQAIVRALRGRLSGIAQPTYVLDHPSAAGKMPIESAVRRSDGSYLFTDRFGATHHYDDMELPSGSADGMTLDGAKCLSER